LAAWPCSARPAAPWHRKRRHRLTYEAFTAQVDAISQDYDDAVNAILTRHQLELMRAMAGRLDNGKEDRHAP